MRNAIEDALNGRIKDISPLSGGCIGQVYRVKLTDGRTVVAKYDGSHTSQLGVEAYMLRYLSAHSELPVPEVLHVADDLLLMRFLPGNSHFGAVAQAHAAELLAGLHGVSAEKFGLERDTLIGGLPQPNPQNDSWLDFFREARLLYMGQEGVRTNRLPEHVFKRLAAFADHLDAWLLEPERPSLIHGDVWTTNVLAQNGRITGFVDPAIYYAHPEIELAFTTLFGTFGRPFFERYQELRAIPPGFFEERRDIYNLYPLLVHVRLFGGSYVNSVDRTLQQFGY
ncbi:MAG: fructosamine kinase family protein [Anaerolineae bacterium]|nr:fructosamine kinase family protein [Anaerolineae bacterium]